MGISGEKFIDGGSTEMVVSVDGDGVWLGFFAKDGRSAVVNLGEIVRTLPKGSISADVIQAWAAERIAQRA